LQGFLPLLTFALALLPSRHLVRLTVQRLSFNRNESWVPVLDRALQRRRVCPRLLGGGVAVFLCSLAMSPAPASADVVSGRVFNDFNTNGVFDTDEDAGAVDVGVSGLTIEAFTSTDTLVGTTTSGAGGAYTLDLPDTRVRLELDVVRPWWPTRQLSGLRSDVQFVDASEARTDVDFGVHRLSEYSIDNPILLWPTQWAGPPVESNPNADEIAIRGAPFFSRRTQAEGVQSWDDLPVKVERGTFEEVGTVFGLALDQANGDLYAGAYQKRLAGLKRRPGTIFKIAEDGNVSVFRRLAAGRDPHPDSEDIEDWVNCEGATVDNPGRCDTSWNFVGKIGLGSVVIDTEDENLYTVNLRRKSLVRLPLVRRPAAAQARRQSTPIPNPGCADADWRPFVAAFDRVNEQLYVGGVCSAETSQQRNDLRAIVYRVDNPRSDPSFVEVLNFPLNYERGRSPDTAITTPLQYCRENTSSVSGGFCRWNPWPTVDSTGGRSPASSAQNGQTITEQNNPSFPQLTAITFAEDGSMILGFRDLMGDMGGVNVPGEIGAGGQAGLGPMLHGDMLRAGPEPNGDFTLEATGRVAGLTSRGQTTNPINWFYGAGMGPGGGYFYNPAPLASTSVGDTLWNIPHPYQGGLTQIPGFADVVATSIHIRSPQENGLLWRDNRTGDTKAALQNFVTPDTDSFTGFAKSNGLGDLDAFTGLAPVQIGNRLWYDTDRDGIQDADEEPVRRAFVVLVDCDRNVVDITRTDRQGEYVFAIEADTCYAVRVPLRQRRLRGWVPTQPFAGEQRRIDSNGVVRNGRSVALVLPKGTGRNDHSYDFGFHRPLPPEPPEPPGPPPPEPPEPPGPPPPDRQPPPGPGVVDRDGPLVLAKVVVRRRQSSVDYAVIVRNGGPNSINRVRVCDRLPAGLAFVSATRSGRQVTGRRVCWRFASLSSGEQRELALRTRSRAAALAGTMVNCATARTRRVGPVRACAAVRGVRPPPPVTG
jgi:uncharacterized repeat protein (TIGR01451 family)